MTPIKPLRILLRCLAHESFLTLAQPSPCSWSLRQRRDSSMYIPMCLGMRPSRCVCINFSNIDCAGAAEKLTARVVFSMCFIRGRHQSGCMFGVPGSIPKMRSWVLCPLCCIPERVSRRSPERPALGSPKPSINGFWRSELHSRWRLREHGQNHPESRVVDRFDAMRRWTRDSWFLVLFCAQSQDMRSGSFPLDDQVTHFAVTPSFSFPSILQTQYVHECFRCILLTRSRVMSVNTYHSSPSGRVHRRNCSFSLRGHVREAL